MRTGSVAVTVLAGLLCWTSVAFGQPAPKPAPATPPAAPAPEEPAEARPPAGATPAKPGTPPPARETPPPQKEPAPADTAGAPAPEVAPGPESTESPDAGGRTPPAGRGAAGTGAPPPSTGLGAGLFPQVEAAPSTPTTRAATRPTEPASEESVLAEDWWSHARPAFEIHGYFRTRAELFHNFSLGRRDTPSLAIWPRPSDTAYTPLNSETLGPAKLCTEDEVGGPGDLDDPADPAHPLTNCSNKTHAGANLRFRLDPELHVSDNLRVVSQIDILDNVVMGSTPSGYSFQPTATGGYSVNQRSGYAPNGVLDDTIVAPSSGVNSLRDSLRVKRVWAEYTTPVGELRFGRMPDHFGLGIVHNSGDGYDDDYQSTIDRLQFITAIKPLDLYVGGSWDFPNEGPIIESSIPGGQAYDAAQLDDVNQWSLLVMRKQSPELTKHALAHEQLVLNGGAYVTLRKQLLANDQSSTTGSPSTASTGSNVPNATLEQLSRGFARRDAIIWVPDLWLQLRYKKFRFEAEAAAVLGSMENTENQPNNNQFAGADLGRKLRQYGLATELEQKLVEDRLRLNFNFGWASGDPDAYNPNGATNNLVPAPGQIQINDDTISTFRFHPAYRVDLILHRYLLQRVQGTYYVKPSVEYDFMRKPTGQRLGGGAGVVWTRASEFVQTPGHASDLGLELDGRLYFQSKDGSLNDHPDRMGGFYAMLEYGVLFPLAGMSYQSAERVRLGNADTSVAQILRLYLGVLF